MLRLVVTRVRAACRAATMVDMSEMTNLRSGQPATVAPASLLSPPTDQAATSPAPTTGSPVGSAPQPVAQDEPLPRIATPDRRVRVFVSSTLAELGEERQLVREAISRLHLTPVMFELGARAHPPRDLYRAYLDQSDVFVGIYWESYGWVAPGEEVSGLEDEYLLSGDRPKLIYVKTPASARDDRLVGLLGRIQRDDGVYKRFRDADQLAVLVADDLAVLLTERFAASRPDTPGLSAPQLPVPLTPLLGRVDEVTRALDLLRDGETRLVTLLGPGGIGKTRLALEVAAKVADAGEAVWFADLTPVAEPGDVPAAIAAVLGVRREGTAPVLDVVADRLRDRSAVVVLDNVEHLVAAAFDIGRLLAAAPGLRVLATSRIALQLRGEREVRVSPLDMPPETSGVDDVAGIGASSAVRLFVARARQVRPDFVLDDTNAAAVAGICRRLDGIPLAIELVAARMRLLTPTSLLSRLDGRLDVAGSGVDRPERQQTLRATLEWSHDLLDADERALFARLGAFADGWTIDAVETLEAMDWDRPPDVVEVLASLVAQSLVVADERVGGEPRFRMLDTIREFACERLGERGERDVTMQRLAAWFRGFASRVGSELGGTRNRAVAACADAERSNVTATMRWAIDVDDADTAIRVSAPLSTYWWSRGLLGEMFEFAERTAALPSAATLSPEAAALLRWCRGMGRVAGGRPAEAEPYLRQLVEDARALGDEWLLAHAYTGLGVTLPYEANAHESTVLLEDAVALFRRRDDAWGIAFALAPLGQLALRRGDFGGATAAHIEALAQADRIDHDHLRAQSLDLLGLDALATGDVHAASERFAAAADIHGRLLDHEGLAYCLEGRAALALTIGRADLAAHLIGAAERSRRTVGVAPWPLVAPLGEQLRAAVAAAIGTSAYEHEVAAGQQWWPADALRVPVDDTSPIVAQHTPIDQRSSSSDLGADR